MEQRVRPGSRLGVADVAAAKAFYERVGWGAPSRTRRSSRSAA